MDPAANDNGSGTVEVQASDGEHAVAMDSFDWTAENVAPSITDLSVVDGSQTACLVMGNVVGVTFGVEPSLPVSEAYDPITGTIDWGDGYHTHGDRGLVDR